MFSCTPSARKSDWFLEAFLHKMEHSCTKWGVAAQNRLICALRHPADFRGDASNKLMHRPEMNWRVPPFMAMLLVLTGPAARAGPIPGGPAPGGPPVVAPSQAGPTRPGAAPGGVGSGAPVLPSGAD